MLTRTNARAERLELLCLALDRLAEAAPGEGTRPGHDVDLRDLGADGYFTAVGDLLAGFGAVELLETPLLLRVHSPHAGYFFRLLSDLLDTRAPLVEDWSREGLTLHDQLLHPFKAAVDLLAVLERRRLELLRDAAPVRELEAAVGLILRRNTDGERSFLLVWDNAAGAWLLPGARRELSDASLPGTLLRELREELDLAALPEVEPLDMIELGVPLDEIRLSPAYGLLTRVRFHAYIVRLHNDLPLGSGLRWTREAEVLAQRTSDGQDISTAPLPQLLARHGGKLDELLQERPLKDTTLLAA